jgi:hypothetical protein
MEDMMNSEADAQVHFGLSEEERQDLHNLISTLGDEKSSDSGEAQPETTSTEIDERIRDMSESIEDFGERMLQLNVEMKSASSNVDERMRQIGSSIAGFSEKLLKLDGQMKAFYKILLLSQKRTELMNKQIDTILEMILDGEGRP